MRFLLSLIVRTPFDAALERELIRVTKHGAREAAVYRCASLAHKLLSYETTMNDQTKHATISAAILWHVAHGKSVREAYDTVFGAGAYAAMAGALYDALRAKAGQQ